MYARKPTLPGVAFAREPFDQPTERECPLESRISRQRAGHRQTADAIEEVKGKGYRIIGGLRDFRDCQFAFVHPKGTNGVLLEYIDDKTEVPK